MYVCNQNLLKVIVIITVTTNYTTVNTFNLAGVIFGKQVPPTQWHCEQVSRFCTVF